MAIYIIKEGQTIFDVTLQLYGSVSRVYDLIKLNPTKIANILERNLIGKEVEYEIQDNETANFYRDNNITITTKYPQANILASFSSSFSSAFSSSYPTA